MELRCHPPRTGDISESGGKQPRIAIFDGQADVVGDGFVVVMTIRTSPRRA
jgi:hypothetical protein